MKTILTKLFVLSVFFLLLSIYYYVGILANGDLRVVAQVTHSPTSPPASCSCDRCTYQCSGVCLANVTCVNTCTGIPCDSATGVSNSSCCSGNVGTTACNATTCTNVGGLGGCPGGSGSQDNCGGVSCDSCGGGGGGGGSSPTPGGGGGGGSSPTPVPTVAGCTTSCTAEACRATTCNNTTCVGSCGQYCYGTMNSTSPTAPTLLLANGSVVQPGNIDLPWSAGSWGQCPGAGSYVVCVGTNSTDPCVGGINLTGISSSQLSYTYVQSVPATYYWKVGVNNGTGLPVVFSAINNFMINSPPTVTSVTLTNSDDVVVPWENTTQSQINNPIFQDASTPREVDFVVVLTDLNGYQNISAVQIGWNGNTYNATLSGGSGNTVTATATAVFGNADNNSSLHNIQINVTDSGGATGMVDTGKSLKVWNGIVPVSGFVYDSANSTLGASCATGEGFTDLAAASMNFNYVDFTPTAGSNIRVNASDDSSYTGGNLIWGKTYTASPNSDFVGTLPLVRWIDMGVGTTSCGTQMNLTSAVVNPYSASPQLNVSFSSVAAQEAWYQVSGGGIQAATNILNLVPNTCALDITCVPAIAKTNNSLLSASNIDNGGCVLGSSGCLYGSPNDWHVNSSTLSSAEKYDYKYFYDKYFLGYGGGTTLPSGATMTTVKSVGGTGVFFVNGNFDVNENNTLNSTQSLLIVAKGTITFSPAVSQSAGIFVADGGMTAGGTSATALTINGTLYSSSSSGHINLLRSYTNQVENNNKPAITVTYHPEYLFNLPGALLNVLSGWKQN